MRSPLSCNSACNRVAAVDTPVVLPRGLDHDSQLIVSKRAAEIAAWITENLFEHLDAPVMRCASLDTPVPFAIPLEKNFLPQDRLTETLNRLLAF
jgi:pyruvate/2-oxoglutarate/acetoin dehydrogenase E1 component